ncbi:hypothetical protein K469DRAFT_726484 [Zopfia rhizophila CBS 207.26]|uniref:Dynamin GTPase domain-containing protein n=1 Tax=Zopfia rhizophila CBS 207.26 TaxID=1314779 RepID=A0A6A6E5T0_9PEZI|nr:hypothetical protein K469DRAFT_726484 [Zopfia rhizophila CBS 207.26]
MSLIDDINKLRSLGVDYYVLLPQLVVYGDQSSGKSLVLEAISGIPFPAKDGFISVAIVPTFHYTLSGQGDFHDLVEKAKEAMGISNSASAFLSNVLRFEISGPTHPHLTIVDLPGLIHSENKVQSRSNVALIQDIVCYYMQNTRSIILVVVLVKNDYANQRTLGEPDTLAVGSESKRAFVDLVKNVDIEFRLG